MQKAVVLFSGGLDSSTCLAIAKAQGFACFALSFDYGQSNRAELKAAQKLAQRFNVVEHKILPLPMAMLGGSAMTEASIAIPDHQEGSTAIPVTYVPARNTIFLSFALSYAEVIGAHDIFIGVNAIDYPGYSDCRPAFIQAFERVANLGTSAGVTGSFFHIHTPLIEFTKADIIKTGVELGVDYSLTVSCYRADTEGRACGTCDSCAFRKKGFREAGVVDPTVYTA